MQDRKHRSWQQNWLRYSSRLAACPENDMLLIAVNKTAWHPLGCRIGALRVLVYKPFSCGHVELASSDPAVPPRVRFNLLTDERDFQRLISGLKMALDLLADHAATAVRNEVFFPSARIVLRISQRNAWNWLRTAAMATALESNWLRRASLHSNAIDVDALSMDEDGLRACVRRWTQPVMHATGTCRMGAVDDPEAVVDAHCRVIGLAGLRVVDASIFPTIPRASTHFPVLMAAEKIADRVKQEWIS